MHTSIWRLRNTTCVVWSDCRHGQTVDTDDTSSASASASVSPPSVKSDVWKYFEKSAESNKTKCSLCSKLLSYCEGTSNVRKHLLTQHPFNYKPKASSKKHPGLVFQAPAFLIGSAKDITDRIISTLALDLKPVYMHGGMRGIQRLGGMPRAWLHRH